ncbi:hypothetical protein CLU79DRAFT_757746 [Phycomyces nitens]|nr:hypothetical protein CLU79DRAFT_757746 [Phycomyces nitens]
MLASDLPFEILSNIAGFLNVRNQRVCVLVCRSWQSPFEELLWKRFFIKKQVRLDQVCSTPVYHKYSSYIQALYLCDFVKVGDKDLQKLQQSFPLVQRLEMGHHTLNACSFGKSDWKLWANLTLLTIDSSGLGFNGAKDKVLEIISCLPLLKELCINHSSRQKTIQFTMEDYESIHAFLPHLENISIYPLAKELTHKEQEKLEMIVAVKRIRSATLYLGNRDLLWLYYYACKYPNLEEIVWVLNCHYDSPLINRRPTETLLATLPPVFPNLRTETVRTIGPIDELYTTMQDLFCPYYIPVESLTYESARFSGSVDCLENNITYATRLYNSTIRKLCLKGCLPRSDLNKRSRLSLRYFSNLVCLRLEWYTIHISIDILLNDCKALKVLKVSPGSLELNSSTFDTIEPSGLQVLCVENGEIQECVLEYLSVCCKDLQHLRINNVRVFVNMSKDTGEFSIDMSQTRFLDLHLHNVSFYPANDIRHDSRINLLAIGHRSVPFLESSVEMTKCSASKDILWFHYFGASQDTDACRELSVPEVQQAQKYFKHFVFNSNLCETSSKRRTRNGCVPRHEWEKDLGRGYVAFKSRVIVECYVTAHSLPGETFWRILPKTIEQ